MKILKNVLKSELKIRTQKDYPIDGMEFIDITPMIIDKDNLNEIIENFSKDVKEKNIDYIIAPEARGFLFGTPVANKLNIGCIPVRKKGKLPPIAIESQVEYKKEYGTDILELPKLLDENGYKGKRFYVIDDIYATGNTVNAIKSMVEKLGGVVSGVGVIMNIVELNDDKDVFSILEINEEV